MESGAIMVANHKTQDGENELVTIDRIEPVFMGTGHLYSDWWVAVGMLFDDPLRMVIKTQDRRKFLDAGYIPADIFKNVVTHVRINVITAWAAGQGLYVGEVLPAHETVLSDSERQAAWKLDIVKFGGFKWDGGDVATFARLGERVVWTKNETGAYVRIEGNTKTVYEGKAQS